VGWGGGGGKGGLCIWLTTLPPSCANCLEIWKPQPPGTLRACPGLLWDCFVMNLYSETAYLVEQHTDSIYNTPHILHARD